MTGKVLAAIVVMALVTYGARALPFFLFKGRETEGFAREFIELVPVALLASLVVPELIMPGGTLGVMRNPFLWAGVLTFLFARFVPNLFLGVSFGMALYWALDKLWK